MRVWLFASILLAFPACGLAADAPPAWAFPRPNPAFKAPPETDRPAHVPGTTKAYTEKQIDAPFDQPDWFPDEHPPMPALVEYGKPPIVHACAQCHLANGAGHPESAELAGLPATYIEQQMAQFREGLRRSSGEIPVMNIFAKAVSDAELKPAAEYFSALKPPVWTKVVEAATVPRTYLDNLAMRFVSPGDAREPIGQRLIEIPESAQGATLKDPHAGFIAYVPPGSIEAGAALVTTGGNGKTIPCTACHGVHLAGGHLTGVGDVPGLAGRSPLYIFRQLYDIQHGSRKGNAVTLMQPVVARLTLSDMIDLAAYLGSLPP